ncbi:MAG: site-specific integrase [Candidatus Accumulibacter sp.]|uniref:site-specific integrase n=1 Tax=Accumulibacter sp. TaxID=2053492 RepID=UPI00287852DE|nr:site-specific integrase [Accumulibacter sp.]MDS4014764.1 site-specific integrase [Accumulibacter sp.]
MLIDPSKTPGGGPLAALSKGFAEDLRRQGYAPRTISEHRRLLRDLSDWLQVRQLTADDLSLRQVDLFLSDRRSAGAANQKMRKALGPILGYLRKLEMAPAAETPWEGGPAGEILNRYRQFLTTERGLVPVTALRYIDRLRSFLDRRMSADGLELGSLTPADVTSFVVAWCPHLNGGVARLTITALRSFLGFLHLDGVTERSLVCAVPSVAHRRLAGLPKGLEPDEVRRLLAACDARTPVGCRDLAILTLLVRLGLRSGEVATLTLDDIDWRTGTIVVRGKGSCIERMPLPPDVGRRLVEYLQHARPANAQGRTVFVRCIAPHHHLGSSRVSTIVADAARRADLGRIHAHRLRHTAATELLRAGASLPEIGQLLRHRHVETTAIYAKVDRDRLRLIARAWPEGDR